MNALSIVRHLNAAVAAARTGDLDLATRHIMPLTHDRSTAYTAVMSCASSIAETLTPRIEAQIPAGHHLSHVAVTRADTLDDPDVDDADDTFAALVATTVNHDLSGAVALLDQVEDHALDRLTAHAVVVVARWADT